MGLDVTAYKNLKKAEGNEAFDEQGELKWEEGWLQIHENNDFPGRLDGLEDRGAYMPEESEHFVSLGYGGYNNWREQLAKLAGYKPTLVKTFIGMEELHAGDAWTVSTSGPFWELINFTDCDGVIGPKVAEKLAKDFADFDEKSKQVNTPGWFYQVYQEFRKAFEMGGQNGAVEFH